MQNPNRHRFQQNRKEKNWHLYNARVEFVSDERDIMPVINNSKLQMDREYPCDVCNEEPASVWNEIKGAVCKTCR